MDMFHYSCRAFVLRIGVVYSLLRPLPLPFPENKEEKNPRINTANPTHPTCTPPTPLDASWIDSPDKGDESCQRRRYPTWAGRQDLTMSLRTMVLLVLAAVAHALPVQNQMAAATAEAAETMVATATAATTTATAATAEASAAVAATVDAAVATMDEAAATAATATEPLTATFAMASDAASDAAASVGFDSIEDFFSFVEEQESSPVPTPDKDLTCVSDASDTHCMISAASARERSQGKEVSHLSFSPYLKGMALDPSYAVSVQ